MMSKEISTIQHQENKQTKMDTKETQRKRNRSSPVREADITKKQRTHLLNESQVTVSSMSNHDHPVEGSDDGDSDISDISDTLPLTAQDIKEMSENEKLNCLLMMVMKLQRKCDINEQMIDRKIQQQLKNHKEEIKKDINKQLVEERKRMDERLALMREETAKTAKDQNQFVVKNLSETKNENLKKKVTSLMRDGLKLNIVPVSVERKETYHDNQHGLIIVNCKNSSDKQTILKAKKKLKVSKQFPNVYIENDKSKERREYEANMKTIAKLLNHDRNVKLRGSRLVMEGNDVGYSNVGNSVHSVHSDSAEDSLKYTRPQAKRVTQIPHSHHNHRHLSSSKKTASPYSEYSEPMKENLRESSILPDQLSQSQDKSQRYGRQQRQHQQRPERPLLHKPTSSTNGGGRHRHQDRYQQRSHEYHTSQIPTTSGIAVNFYGNSESDYGDYSDCVGKRIESPPPSKRYKGKGQTSKTLKMKGHF